MFISEPVFIAFPTVQDGSHSCWPAHAMHRQPVDLLRLGDVLICRIGAMVIRFEVCLV